MYDLSMSNSITFQCVSDPSYDGIVANGGVTNGCGTYWGAVLFFVTYEVLVTFIFLNLFIAIILQGFE
jgi:hypothetical protein